MKKKRVLLLMVLLAGLITTRNVILAGTVRQERTEEEKVHLISAQMAQMYELFGVSYRKVTGPARFLHNNTYILCDTAIWNTADNIIDAVGNVQIIQEGTQLTGETIHYLGDLNIAQVRGRMVELIDKEENRLRTQYLDFNTKDSIAYFFNGGSVVDNKGTILESRRGYYYSKEKLFCLYEHVEMGTDTLRLKADSLYYHSDLNLAEFWGNVQAWHTDGFLTAQEGTYKRDEELYHFMHDVFIRTEEQEIRAEDVHYDKGKNSGLLRHNVQVRDTTQQVHIMGDRLDFRREPDWIQVTEDPVFIAWEINRETNSRDSLFLRADTLLAYTSTYGEMDSLERVRAFERQEIPERKKNAATADSMSRGGSVSLPASVAFPDSPGVPVKDTLPPAKDIPLSPEDIPSSPQDSLPPVKDTVPDPVTESVQNHLKAALLEVQLSFVKADSTLLSNVTFLGDSLFNTTEVHFLYGYNNVKVYKSDIQSLCDSLVFNSIDSMMRQYGSPVLWNQESQLSADSIQFRFSRDSLYRVDFLSNAFLISQEEEVFFHQIKADLMYAHVRDNDIYRFDAIKNAKALFYIPEDSIITSLNIKECDQMNVWLKDRRAQRIVYKTAVKSDMIPLYDLKKDQERLAGFTWRAPDRPLDRYAITPRTIVVDFAQPGTKYTEPLFPYTLKYFPAVHALPSTLRTGVTTDAVKELSQRERENRINPYIPLKDMPLTPEKPAGIPEKPVKMPENARKITPALQRKQLQIQEIE
ncbi:MAG TPA: OstA-like protein [Bacteroidales bacterium]|nr:OstA-like protein [Bacteroidales bacterium]HOR11645.1 OstA-like protein [Bacteroidales bacterium]HOZ19592.1 OstA-like protein [Bacteroidales bacterium]HPB77523.1 OstA-like protein [Bacteroidales bacterium]HPK39193.1 OstA-like protein [Bacteroidales bacterium]